MRQAGPRFGPHFGSVWCQLAAESQDALTMGCGPQTRAPADCTGGLRGAGLPVGYCQGADQKGTCITLFIHISIPSQL